VPWSNVGTGGALTHLQPLYSSAIQPSIGWSGVVFASAFEVPKQRTPKPNIATSKPQTLGSNNVT